MGNYVLKIFLFVFLFANFRCQAVTSLVYNLRISETTKRQAVVSQQEHPYFNVSLLQYNRFSKTRDGVRDIVNMGLVTMSYTASSYYFSVDIAGGHDDQKTCVTHASKTQADDILFTGGYGVAINPRIKVTASVLLGFPFHNDVSLLGPEIGLGHIGLGGQLDGAFVYSAREHHSIRAAARAIHFFPRTVEAEIGHVIEHFRYNIGNLYDLFIAHHSELNNHHHVEVGYNPTFLVNAKICPFLEEVVQATNFMRSSFYGTYNYDFLIRKKWDNAVGFGLSTSFDHTPKKFGHEWIVSFWLVWGINF